MTPEYWMRRALELAQQAFVEGEVPVGAVLTWNNTLLGEGYNQSITRHDPTAHAEIVALRQAAKKAHNYRLVNTTLYVTLEPCAMCVGALIHARVQNLMFGALDPKTGAVISACPLLNASHHNHQIVWQGECLAEECGEVLKAFFRLRRNKG